MVEIFTFFVCDFRLLFRAPMMKRISQMGLTERKARVQVLRPTVSPDPTEF